MNAISLVVDRLHVGYLGCYGNSWISTPNFDRLAADGFLFDQALIESPQLARQYAGQFSLLDVCLGVLLDDLDRLPGGARALFSLLSARGFPLGEHRRVGAIDQALYAELVHVPWILRFPDGRGASDRSQALVQPCY